MADAKEKINLLDVIPFRSENITAEKGSDGTVTIAFPRFKYEWMRRFLLPKGMSPDIHVRLEEHGTAVWELTGSGLYARLLKNLQSILITKKITNRVLLLISPSCRRTDL
jgi:hypothetical protein